jgi:hypothetical protein
MQGRDRVVLGDVLRQVLVDKLVNRQFARAGRKD